MAFKINKSIIQGTSSHASALKSVEYDRAAKKDPNLASYVKKRKSLQKGSDEYKANQSKINKAYSVGSKSSSTSPKSSSTSPKSSSTIKKPITNTTKPTNGKKGTDFYGKKTLEPLSNDAGNAWVAGKVTQSKVGQKVIKKVAGKGMAKLGAKVASRLVPGLGWALAAYDVAKLGYYSAKKGSFKEGLKDLGRDYGADDLGFYE
tara:strand:- start:389 stop:1000 length:612 start_codon:yes stop_codon:yes gene_type:complete